MPIERTLFFLFNAERDAASLTGENVWSPLASFACSRSIHFTRLVTLYRPKDVVHLDRIKHYLETHGAFRSCRYMSLTDSAAGNTAGLVDHVQFLLERESKAEQTLFVPDETSLKEAWELCKELALDINFVRAFPPAPDEPWPGVIELHKTSSGAGTRYRPHELDSGVNGQDFLKSGIQTKNSPFNLLIEELEQVVRNSSASMLFLGPTGAGKSLLVRRIYELKKKTGLIKGAFVELNCASVQGALAQSMLFGHAKGAFTGATCAREGLLRKANHGILFLDEVGSLGLEEQALLLKAIEEKSFYPLGSDKEATSEFQLVCGSNQDLYSLMHNGRFREDLLSRCNTWTFTLPGLAHRPEDIEPNLDYELSKQGGNRGRELYFSQAARRRFLEFASSPECSWPGNFRDFSACVQRMSAFAFSDVIELEAVEREIERLQAHWERSAQGQRNGTGHSYPCIVKVLGADALGRIDLFDLPQLEGVLRVCQKSRSIAEAGRKLYAVSRQARTSFNDSDRLRKYLASFGLSWERASASDTGQELLQASLSQPDNSKNCRLN